MVLIVICTLVALFAVGMYVLSWRDRHRPPEAQESIVRAAFQPPQSPQKEIVGISLSTIGLPRARVIEIGAECGYEFIGVKDVTRGQRALQFKHKPKGSAT